MAVDYKTYLKMQKAGPIHKPEHYHIAEKKTIDYFFRDVPAYARIIDVGCAIGLGIKYLLSLGYEHLTGIDIDERKIAASEVPSYLVRGDIMNMNKMEFSGLWDVIYCSHTLEHVFDPVKVIEVMKLISKQRAKFFFVLPYPNPNPSPAHWSTPVLGLDVDDEAATVSKWFTDQGLQIDELRFDAFREPEIWLTMRKA